MNGSTLSVSSGRTMRIGEILQPGDWRHNGHAWEPVPEPCIGHSLQVGHGMVYVHPQEDSFPRK